MPSTHPNVGKTAKYTPKTLTKDQPCEGQIEMYEEAGYIFNQPMLTIVGVDHWIPARECIIE